MSFKDGRILKRIATFVRMQQVVLGRSYMSTSLRRPLCYHEFRRTFRNIPKQVISTRSLNTKVLRPYVDSKLSYAFGRSEEILVYSTVARELDKQIQRSPNEVALICHSEGIQKTFSEFNHDINKLAKAMKSNFGLTKGDIVGVFAYNCYNWVLIQFACSKIGAILTPINPSYKAHELEYVLKKGKIKCLFMPGPDSVQRELNDHMRILLSQEVINLASNKEGFLLENVILLDSDKEYNMEPFSSKLRQCKFHNWSSTLANDGVVYRSEQEADEAGIKLEDACILSPELVSPEDLFAVYYTSGTTGQPKGACVSQYTVINNVRLCQLRLREGRPRDWTARLVTTLPLFHIFAGVLNALTTAVSNTKVIFSSHKYDIRAFVEAIIQHEGNVTTLTPTILIDMLTFIEQNNLANEVNLKVIQPGGAAIPPELISRAFKLLPSLEDVRSGYGSTENGGVATFQTAYEPDHSRSSTVGPPLDFTEIRVVRAGGGGNEPGNHLEDCVALGELGEIQTRGYNTMVEYLDDPKKTDEVVTKDRWYRTGDIGTMHPHGSIQITGRSKHMIIKGGENIYPEEVEQMMLRMECIEKVHVIGVPDQRFGEQVCAWIKLKPDYTELKGDCKEITNRDPKAIHKEDVLKFCRDNITYFKVPKYLLFVDDFPMTPTKKVQNHVMIEESIKILGLENVKA